jgi:hypothetical protein
VPPPPTHLPFPLHRPPPLAGRAGRRGWPGFADPAVKASDADHAVVDDRHDVWGAQPYRVGILVGLGVL